MQCCRWKLDKKKGTSGGHQSSFCRHNAWQERWATIKDWRTNDRCRFTYLHTQRGNGRKHHHSISCHTPKLSTAFDRRTLQTCDTRIICCVSKHSTTFCWPRTNCCLRKPLRFPAVSRCKAPIIYNMNLIRRFKPQYLHETRLWTSFIDSYLPGCQAVLSANKSDIKSLNSGIFKHTAVRIANLSCTNFSRILFFPRRYSPRSKPIPHSKRLANF